ncbi:hypothetical protein JTE90_004166 [Oedothorax gibbosus]|uniref:Uncharacterized protein n=1 Tax=Oedothorax gibbosus TaxID=931172 RepID=A0AAV6TUV6_9ARAC|nr:hypothetical protein JTE90_004166 [Oedothorax gibbosus]
MAQPQCFLTGGPNSVYYRPDSPREICRSMNDWKMAIDKHIIAIEAHREFLANLSPLEVQNRDLTIKDLNYNVSMVLDLRKNWKLKGVALLLAAGSPTNGIPTFR